MNDAPEEGYTRSIWGRLFWRGVWIAIFSAVGASQAVIHREAIFFFLMEPAQGRLSPFGVPVYTELTGMFAATLKVVKRTARLPSRFSGSQATRRGASTKSWPEARQASSWDSEVCRRRRRVGGSRTISQSLAPTPSGRTPRSRSRTAPTPFRPGKPRTPHRVFGDAGGRPDQLV